MIRDGANVVVLGVYWFLVLVAVVFAGVGLWQAGKMRGRRPVQARVVERAVRVEVREVPAKRGKVKSLYALADLKLDTGVVVPMREERRISYEEFVSHAFLDQWEVGAVREAAEMGGVWELDPTPAWVPVAGFGLCALLFGTFAWMARPFAYGERLERIGVTFFVLALFPIGAAGFGIWMNLQKAKVGRTVVEGKGREMGFGDFLAELKGLGVVVAGEVGPFVDKEKVQFCEFPWEGKVVRSVSLYCQKGEGESCAARVNGGDLRDVKWGEED